MAESRVGLDPFPKEGGKQESQYCAQAAVWTTGSHRSLLTALEFSDQLWGLEEFS